jgi:hypothetical protein
MYVLCIYLSPKHEFPKGIWMIHVVEEIKLLLLLSNHIIKPDWTYGIELWGCSKPSNTKVLQTLRKLANAPWYISNLTLHNDLRVPYVTEVIRTYAKNHKNRTARNNNQLIRDLFNQSGIGRRLNRMDLIRQAPENHRSMVPASDIHINPFY